MLLASLGLVLMAMRHLNRPETARRIGQIFGADEIASAGVDADDIKAIEDQQEAEGIGIVSIPARQHALMQPESELSNTDSSGELDSNTLGQVRDNTYFRPVESAAWFALFDRLGHLTGDQLSEQTLGELTYAQLLKQPNVYRGKVVTVRGVVHRVELQQAPSNEIGIESYHRLWIEPKGGANWPIVVYSLNLPQEFPVGDRLKAGVSVTGFFFKNWSYPWRDGLGVAPVVLSRDLQWQESKAVNQSTIVGKTAAPAVIIACAVAALVVYMVVRGTRRPRRATEQIGTPGLPVDGAEIEAIRDELQALADAEPNQ